MSRWRPHRRFEKLLGGTTVAELPLRIFVFHDRGAFLRFHMRIFPALDLASCDGLYQGHPYRLLTLCTAPAPGRISNPQHTTRSLAAYALLESVWGSGPPAWLQSGLSKAVADCDDPDRLSRLNRKMVASLARERHCPRRSSRSRSTICRGRSAAPGTPSFQRLRHIPLPGLVHRGISLQRAGATRSADVARSFLP